jgi:hypothetical protein
MGNRLMISLLLSVEKYRFLPKSLFLPEYYVLLKYNFLLQRPLSLPAEMFPSELHMPHETSRPPQTHIHETLIAHPETLGFPPDTANGFLQIWLLRWPCEL